MSIYLGRNSAREFLLKELAAREFLLCIEEAERGNLQWGWGWATKVLLMCLGVTGVGGAGGRSRSWCFHMAMGGQTTENWDWRPGDKAAYN